MTTPNEKRESATRLIKHLLGYRDDSLVLSQMKELLSTLIWKFTEADGKYSPEFISEGATTETNTKMLIHEHVYERRRLIERFLGGEEPEAVLKDAIACVVTKDEHSLLEKQKHLNGWERYLAAGIKYSRRNT